MIRYTLSCDKGHTFESWFASAAACDGLIEAGRVACLECGSTVVEKALMTPSVNHGTAAPAAEPKPAADTPNKKPGPLSAPQTPLEQALAALRKEIEAKSDYVGLNFAAEARAIHAGEAPERSIFGEARPDEARALIEDGVPVAPLPFLPARKTN
jgi:hypothetical protein